MLKRLLIKRTITLFALLLFTLLFATTEKAYATDHYNKEWNSAIITGPLSDSDHWRYYLEQQLRLIDDNYVFNQAFFLPGIGYAVSDKVTLFTGPGYIFTKNTNDQTYNVYRAWQQADWKILTRATLSLISRTRLQEDTRSNASGTLVVFRERYWLRIPIKNTPYYYSCFDELFFNVNSPTWSTHTVLEQNRVFLGIARKISKSALVDFGYVNQEVFGTYNQINNVLLLTFTVSF